MTTANDILKQIKDKDVKFLDLRFTDPKGKWQHLTMCAGVIGEDELEDGLMFDGSSIAGWKGINESDMILMPDPKTAVLDPFFEDTTLNLRCDIIEPATMQGYERDPRSLAKRAEAYLKSTGIADTAFFGPEPEFFIFDSVRWGNDMSGCFSKIESEEAAWNTGKEYEHGNSGFRPAVKGGYFPVAPVDSAVDIRGELGAVARGGDAPPALRSFHGRVLGPGCPRISGGPDVSACDNRGELGAIAHLDVP